MAKKEKNLLATVYAEYIANWLTKGNLIAKEKITSLGLKPVFDRFLTRKRVTRVWTILAVPVHFENNLPYHIRTQMFKLHPKVKTIVHTYNKPVRIDVRSRKFTTQLTSATRQFDRYAQIYTQLSDDQRMIGAEFNVGNGSKVSINKEHLLAIRDNKDSYDYIFESVTGNQAFFLTYMFVQASAPDIEELNLYENELYGLLDKFKVAYGDITGELTPYLNNYCPAVYKQQEMKKTYPMLMSEQNLSLFMPNKTQGLVGGNGLMLGIEWTNKLPLMINFFESSAAQVIMLCGKTGCGKTYTAFNVCVNAIGIGVHASALDLKGNEWCKLSPFVDTLIISMDEADSRFVNTLRLDDLDCDESNCLDMFNTTVNGTIMLMSIIVNLMEMEGNPTDLEAVLRLAINKLYSKNGVIAENPATFYKTRSMKYGALLEIIDELMSSNSFNEEQYKMCNLIKSRCANYFAPEGLYAYLFRNEITVGEILNTPLVIYSFNKNAGGELDNLDTLKVFMVQFLDSKKQELRKRKKLHTFAFYEELQRCQQSEKLISYISSRVTGSRSSNVSVFLLFNAISIFRNGELAQIKSNITTRIIGKMDEEDIKILSADFGCKPIESMLKAIADPESMKYNNCFAIQYDTGLHSDKAIFKTFLPLEIEENFNTRDRMNL